MFITMHTNRSFPVDLSRKPSVPVRGDVTSTGPEDQLCQMLILAHITKLLFASFLLQKLVTKKSASVTYRLQQLGQLIPPQKQHKIGCIWHFHTTYTGKQQA